MFNINWQFDNSYARLPNNLFSKLNPVPVTSPKLIIFNEALGQSLGLHFENLSDFERSALFSGNILPSGSEPIAQAYAGHQFGHFTMLGDGRAILLGEHITPNKQRVDIQLKGSGQTPYSRNGDGRSALGPMLREYIISEAMHALEIPSSRSLAVVTTGEIVHRERPFLGAILTRVASSHIRIGTFEYAAALGNLELLKTLTHYTIQRHYPYLLNDEYPIIGFLNAVAEKQAQLITHWIRVGFIHGVMNTDNTMIAGETLDYGPCAFMDHYDPKTVFSSIDINGRYAFNNQPFIAQWNLARFAEALLPLLHPEEKKAIQIAEDSLHAFANLYQKLWLSMMRQKLGLMGEELEDLNLIQELLNWMHAHQADYTNTFLALSLEKQLDNDLFKQTDFVNWHERWNKRRERNLKPISKSIELMRKVNPAIIPRNHQVEKALKAAMHHDLKPMNSLLDALSRPYEDLPEHEAYRCIPEPRERVCQTFCGT